MAEIDKGLPNTRTKLDIPSEEEIAEQVDVQEQEPRKRTYRRLYLKKMVV